MGSISVLCQVVIAGEEPMRWYYQFLNKKNRKKTRTSKKRERERKRGRGRGNSSRIE